MNTGAQQSSKDLARSSENPKGEQFSVFGVVSALE
jgi:hypothetical protein